MDSRETPKGEAKTLLKCFLRGGVSLERMLDLIQVDQDHEKVLRKDVGEHAGPLEQHLHFRRKVRFEFLRLARKHQEQTQRRRLGRHGKPARILRGSR